MNGLEKRKQNVKKIDWPWDMHAEAFMRTAFLPRARWQGFFAEQFRAAAEKQGCPMPGDAHAWGGFMKKMKNAGLIRREGFGLDSYGSPKSLWRAA